MEDFWQSRTEKFEERQLTAVTQEASDRGLQVTVHLDIHSSNTCLHPLTEMGLVKTDTPGEMDGCGTLHICDGNLAVVNPAGGGWGRGG